MAIEPGLVGVVDVVVEHTGGHEDEVVEGGSAGAGRVPRPVVVLGVEVLDGGDFQAVRGAGRGLKPVQRGGLAHAGARWRGPAGLSAGDHEVSVACRQIGLIPRKTSCRPAPAGRPRRTVHTRWVDAVGHDVYQGKQDECQFGRDQ